jgi:hypothetical protein
MCVTLSRQDSFSRVGCDTRRAKHDQAKGDDCAKGDIATFWQKEGAQVEQVERWDQWDL